MIMGFHYLDQQMEAYIERLVEEVRINKEASKKLATTIAAEVRFLDEQSKELIRRATPIPLKARIEELKAFQAWMDLASNVRGNPAVTRAQVIVQNYVCFIYLGEACFRVLARSTKSKSATRACCRYLTENPIRAFRNALAHANWEYKPDYSGLIFWAKKGSDPNESLSGFEVSQEDLNFWQALSRCVAYAAYTNL